MNFEALESFRIFAKTLNFTHTAKLRHVSQPALHKQIRNLGDSLGVELYRRDGRTLKLTEAGNKLARFAREMLDRTAQLHGEIHQGAGPATVSLAAGVGSFLYLLGNAMSDFLQTHPNALTLLTENQTGVLSAIRQGEAHLGVTVLSELPKDLSITLLHEITPRLIVSTSHPLASRKSARLKALDDLPLICPTPPSSMRPLIAAALEQAGFRFNPVLNTTGWELMMHFASLNMGAAIVNGCCRPPAGTVAIRLPDLPKTRYYLVSASATYDFPELVNLRQCIIQRAKKVQLFD